MKALLIAVLSLPVSVFGGDFDNWYFEFLSERCEISGKTFSPDGKETGTFTGASTGKVSPKGAKFTESFEYIYMPGDHKAKDSLVWTKGKDGIFRSASKDSAGNRFSIELTVKADHHYDLKSTFADGRTIETKAKLREGVIHAVDTARTKEGEVVFVLKYTRSKAVATNRLPAASRK
ncbi:MAG: hypothetical protein KDN22_20840 [Verrucomicrobiae bacterium]|nr:hypothetical protein [Verrucomicrobiae bacterium]